MVDSGVYHLDQTFDYRIPEALEAEVAVGSRVQVSFNGIRREGIVYAITDTPEKAGRLHSIERLLGPSSVISSQTIELVQEVARRWAAHPYDIWRSALASRVISVEKKLPAVKPMPHVDKPIKQLKNRKSYLLIPHATDPYQALLRVAGGYLPDGNVLLILPDEKDTQRFLDIAPQDGIINLSSALGKSDRYAHYLSLERARNNLIIGSRSAIFASIPNVAAVIVHREISENHYEQRSPGWNTRDVALIRAHIEGSALIFTGYGPSSEMAALIAREEISFIGALATLNIVAAESREGELIPSALYSGIRTSIKNGPVLVLVPQKGYASGVICAKCRNIAYHECGGVLRRSSLKSSLQCAQCLMSPEGYACKWCNSQSFSITARGSTRIVEEIGRAFPGIVIRESTGEHLLSRLEHEKGIVVATAGAQPIAAEGYSGVFILEAQRFLAGIDMRSIERSYEQFFATLALASPNAILGISLPSEHPAIAGLSRWNPKNLLNRMLREREEASLPPFRKTIEFKPQLSEIHMLERGFVSARTEGRLPLGVSVVVHGSVLRLYVPESDQIKAIDFVHEFQRKRSLAGKKMVPMRVEPFTLN